MKEMVERMEFGQKEESVFGLVKCSGRKQTREWRVKTHQTVLKRQVLHPCVESRYINKLQEYQSTERTYTQP